MKKCTFTRKPEMTPLPFGNLRMEEQQQKLYKPSSLHLADYFFSSYQSKSKTVQKDRKLDHIQL